MKQVFPPKQLPLLLDAPSLTVVNREPGYRYPFAGGRSEPTFIYALEGHITYRFESSVLDLSKGSFAFIPPKICHEALYGEQGASLWVLTFACLQGELPQKMQTPFVCVDRENLFADAAPDKHTGPYELIALLYRLIGFCERESRPIPPKYRPLMPAIKQMHLHCEENEKVCAYAALCHMSETSFRRCFTAYTGISPIEYRNRLRLEKAAKMIHSGEYSVAEAAAQVGFDNLPFFYRSYKNHFGITPGQSKE